MGETVRSTAHLIRDYREADFPSIAALWAATDLGNPARGDDSSVIHRTLVQGGIFLVVEASSSGHVIGSSWMTHDGRRLYLHHFGIAPQFQRQGLGKALLLASLARAKALGLQIKLEVHRENTAAVALYRNHGFAHLGDYEVYILRDPSMPARKMRVL